MADNTIQFPRKRVPRHWSGPRFLSLIASAVWLALGAALWQGLPGGRIFLFAFVLVGWALSLVLHEFAHALVAWWGGDRDMVGTGELTLEPARYANALLSLIFPIIFFVFGGIGLPGPADVTPHHVRSRGWQVAVAAAGPAMTLVLFLALLAVYRDVPMGELRQGLASLAYLQATAIVLDLLPVPGLDGFAMLRPFLPIDIVRLGDQMGPGPIFLLFFLIWWYRTGISLSLTQVAADVVPGIDAADIVTYGFPLIWSS